MSARVTDKSGLNGALHESPDAIVTFETVQVATACNRLKRKIFDGLEHGVVGLTCCGACDGVDLDEQITSDMPGARRSVGVHLERTPSKRDNRISAADRGTSAEGEVAMLQEVSQTVEIAAVNQKRIPRDQILDSAFVGHIGAWLEGDGLGRQKTPAIARRRVTRRRRNRNQITEISIGPGWAPCRGANRPVLRSKNIPQAVAIATDLISSLMASNRITRLPDYCSAAVESHSQPRDATGCRPCNVEGGGSRSSSGL